MHNIISPEIAIIHPDILVCTGLQQLLKDIAPQVIVRTFSTFGQFTDDTPDMYVHCFVSAQIYFDHTAFFLERRHKTIVLTAGGHLPRPAGIHVLDTHQDGQHLAKAILQLHGSKRTCGDQHPHVPPLDTPELSAREVEVLRLVVLGYLNKEIADKLNISLTTVISHRKNIVEKLGIRTVPGLTIYAVTHGYVEANQI